MSMQQPKFHHYHSTHREHLLYAIIILLLGALFGYGLGVAYEAERAAGDTFGQVTNLILKKTSHAHAYPAQLPIDGH